MIPSSAKLASTSSASSASSPAPSGPRRSSLAVKWTLSMLVVGVVPMLVLGLAVLRIQRESMSRVEKELEIAIVDEAASNVNALVDKASDLATRTSAILADEDRDVDARMRAIRAEASRTPEVVSVAFFDQDRHFVDAVVSRDSTEEVAPPAGNGVRVVPAVGGGAHVRFERPLDGGPGGFVVVTLGRGPLDGRLRDLSLARFGAPDRLYLVDERLHVVAGGAMAAKARPPIFDDAQWPAAAFASELLVTTEFVGDGIAKVGTVRTLPAARLAVVVERPADEAFAALTKSRRTFLWTLAVFAALAGLAGIVLARRTLGPVTLLVRLVERYSRRDFAARSEVRSRDELEALGGSLERMADELSASEDEIRRRAKVESDLSRFLPGEVARSVAEGTGSLALGGARKPVTVVFADVVAFTTFAERASPERAVAFLNELFTILSEIVFRHGGMVDKFIGDCIMAVFVPDEADDASDHVRRALFAAEDMHRFVESNAPRFQSEYEFDVRLGIGVATGEALVGNLGSEARMEYTAIGDVVNVAARLETLASAKQTLTTADVAEACPDLDFASLGKHCLRGRVAPVEVFEVKS
ncbi:Adenylate cyclase [Labilithrix luteola]|uniref:Adenylate cyclase n=1 Tax=Labilithrix luteola TaxID=1391654 RepID=A0A0K1PLX4_9BACT|nr:adenylate/guanylate cyclase domain-containing protein [Labilithrix luteola]AKU94525.1 Adenylate cyclase [Labilithrix luteola]